MVVSPGFHQTGEGPHVGTAAGVSPWVTAGTSQGAKASVGRRIGEEAGTIVGVWGDMVEVAVMIGVAPDPYSGRPPALELVQGRETDRL